MLHSFWRKKKNNPYDDNMAFLAINRLQSLKDIKSKIDVLLLASNFSTLTCGQENAERPCCEAVLTHSTSYLELREE